MTDFRALIHRMADELDHYRQLLTDNRTEIHPLAAEARAALSQPELAYRMVKAGDDLNRAHLDGVLLLLREHITELEGA